MFVNSVQVCRVTKINKYFLGKIKKLGPYVIIFIPQRVFKFFQDTEMCFEYRVIGIFSRISMFLPITYIIQIYYHKISRLYKKSAFISKRILKYILSSELYGYFL